MEVMIVFSRVFKFIYNVSRVIPHLDKVLYILFRCIIPRNVRIGENVVFNHSGFGTVIHPNAVIGNNVWIEHHVLLGQKTGLSRNAPTIEDDCVLGAYAIVLGGVTIGKGSVVGAGTIITEDIPPNSIVYNKKEKVIKKNYKPKDQY